MDIHHNVLWSSAVINQSQQNFFHYISYVYLVQQKKITYILYSANIVCYQTNDDNVVRVRSNLYVTFRHKNTVLAVMSPNL